MKNKVFLMTFKYPGVGGIERSFEILEDYLTDREYEVSILAFESFGEQKAKSVVRLKYNFFDHMLILEPLKTYRAMIREVHCNRNAYEHPALLVRHLPISYALSKLSIEHSYLPPCVSNSFFMGVISSIKQNESGLRKFIKLVKWNSIRIIYNHFEKYVLKKGSATIYTFSENVKRNLLLSNKVDRKIEVVPPGIDERNFFSLQPSEIRSRRRRLGISDDKFVILYVGRLSAGKNVEVLLEAFESLDVKEKLLLIVGSGHYKLNESKDIRLIGSKRIDELHEFYNVANVTVLPTFNEGFGQVLIESLGCGTPVLGFDTENNAVNEIITHELFGLKTKSQAVCGMRKLLLEFYANRASYDFKRKRIERESKSVFSWDLFISKVFRD